MLLVTFVVVFVVVVVVIVVVVVVVFVFVVVVVCRYRCYSHFPVLGSPLANGIRHSIRLVVYLRHL